MKPAYLHRIVSILGLCLFLSALWVLHHELQAYRYRDIVQQVRHVPTSHLALALLLTCLSYLSLTVYDVLALRYIRYPLVYRKIAFASFVGYAFAHNIGLSWLTGGSVRYRLYSTWGIPARDIAKVVLFCTLTFWLGLGTVGGVVFLVLPVVLPPTLSLPFVSLRSLGLTMLLVVVVYLIVSAIRRTPLRVRDRQFSLPTLRIALAQIAIASLDLALVGGVLYVLLPAQPHFSYPMFLGIYLLAQVAGVASQVPGGLGIFESVLLMLLPVTMPASAVVGSLFVYRSIYYLLPLVLAAVGLGVHEVWQRQEGVVRFTRTLGEWTSIFTPHVLACSTFVGGVILLFSGATPGVTARLVWLKPILPLPVVEISHFLGSVTGLGLLLLARGLQRRLDAAYLLTVVLLSVGVAVSLLKGGDYEEAIALAVMLIALLPCRPHFYRRTSLLHQQFTSGWIVAIVLVVGCSVWLGLFAYRHVEYSHELWWHFSLTAQASRFLRATVAVCTITLVFAIVILLRPASATLSRPTPAVLAQAQAVAAKSRRGSAYLALLGDKTLLFHKDGQAFLMFGIAGRSWVVM